MLFPFLFLLPLIAATLSGQTASPSLPSSIPSPTPSETACQIAARALKAVSATRPTPYSNFTAYMDAHDPFVRGCSFPFPASLNSTLALEAAYFEEAAWYNAAYPTTSQLVVACEAERPVLGERNWREIGLRQGLPSTWKDVTVRFPPCPVVESKPQPTGANGRSHKGGRPGHRNDSANHDALLASGGESLLESIPWRWLFATFGLWWF